LLDRLLFLGVLFFLFTSCHLFFNNPVDPDAEDYIGYEVVLDLNKVVNLSPKDNEEIRYPALLWSKVLADVTYSIEISPTFYFVNYGNVYTNYLLKENQLALVSYNEKKKWDTVGQDALWSLPAGKYWWRTNVKGDATLGQWGDWCNPTSFVQELRLTEMYWKFDEEDSSAVQQGYRYYFDLYGRAEKELYFIKFSSESEPRLLEAVVTLSSEKKRQEKEMLFGDIDCAPTSLQTVKEFIYELGFEERVDKREKYLTMNGGVELDEKRLIEVEYYSYASDSSKDVTEVRKMKIDESGNEVLYYVSEYEGGLQKKTSFYSDGAIKYYYDLYYLTDYPKKPSRAEYYMKNAESGEMEYYNDYLLKYNLPVEAGGNGGVTIGLGRGASSSDFVPPPFDGAVSPPIFDGDSFVGNF